MIYDIRTKEFALMTLERMTNVASEVWIREPETASLTDDHIDSIIQRYNGRLVNVDDLKFIFSHLTSSAEECRSIRNDGLLDLRDSYENPNSELRRFLDAKHVVFDLDLGILSWNGKTIDISYRGLSLLLSDTEQTASRIGYRFYKDQNVCGFLSLGRTAYLTHVEEKPEILIDIGDLIGMDIAGEWKYTHQPYEITAKVDSDKVIRDGDAIHYACLAYWNSFDDNQNILLCKDGVNIPPDDIVDIYPFRGWK